MGPKYITRVRGHLDNSSGSNNNKLHIFSVGEKIANIRKAYVFQATAKCLIHSHYKSQKRSIYNEKCLYMSNAAMPL